jgi:hypothetical protein
MQRLGPSRTEGWGHIHFNYCNKGVKMNIWASFFIRVLQKQNLLIEEQKVSDPNPRYELAQDIASHNKIPTSGSYLVLTSTPHTPKQGKSIKSISIIHHFLTNSYFYFIHCRITYAATYTKILS